MNALPTAFLILVMAAGSLLSASQEQNSEQPVAEVLGKLIYPKDLATPTGRYQQQGEAAAIDEEQQLARDRERLRNMIWAPSSETTLRPEMPNRPKQKLNRSARAASRG